MHYSECSEDLWLHYQTTISGWRSKGLTEFTEYFEKQWGPQSFFHNWQMFHTPRGYATTNNPVETFNSALKVVSLFDFILSKIYFYM
jgi:hypothetical protein